MLWGDRLPEAVLQPKPASADQKIRNLIEWLNDSDQHIGRLLEDWVVHEIACERLHMSDLPVPIHLQVILRSERRAELRKLLFDRDHPDHQKP